MHDRLAVEFTVLPLPLTPVGLAALLVVVVVVVVVVAVGGLSRGSSSSSRRSRSSPNVVSLLTAEGTS